MFNKWKYLQLLSFEICPRIFPLLVQSVVSYVIKKWLLKCVKHFIDLTRFSIVISLIERVRGFRTKIIFIRQEISLESSIDRYHNYTRMFTTRIERSHQKIERLPFFNPFPYIPWRLSWGGNKFNVLISKEYRILWLKYVYSI
jgi:hypothetical protein